MTTLLDHYGRDLDCLADGRAADALPLHSVRPEGLEAALATLPAVTAAFVRAGGFHAAPGQLVLLPGTGGPDGGLAGALLGLGDDRSPWAHGGLPTALPPGTAWRLEDGDFDRDGAVLGFCLGAYRFDALRRAPRPIAVLAGAAESPALDMARAIWLARDLINTPANLLGPAELANAAATLAERHGAAASLVTGQALAEGYPSLAAVGLGSARAPVVASFTWRGTCAGPDAPHVSLCGKGVCFDSGGYDLKPAAGMLRMKKDMGGAALMLGLASAIMQRDLPVRLSVRIGCVENMVSGAAMRPLDVLRTRRGLTVEVGNTDAEGRLVLCDLLAEASDESPDLLIDAATLTGAARVAVGPDLPAVFTPDDELAALLSRSAAECHDPVWRLPLHAGYDQWLSSPIADLGNVSSKPYAGAIIAALFLQRFVAPRVRWLHIDTYAWNDATRAGRPEGGEGQALQSVFSTIQSIIEPSLKSIKVSG